MESRDPGPIQWKEMDSRAFRHKLEPFLDLLEPQAVLIVVVRANAKGRDLSGGALGEAEDDGWLWVPGVGDATGLKSGGRQIAVLVSSFAFDGHYRELDQDISFLFLSIGVMKAAGGYPERSKHSLPDRIPAVIDTTEWGEWTIENWGLIGSARRRRLGVVGAAGNSANIEDTIKQECDSDRLLRREKSGASGRRELGAIPDFILTSSTTSVRLLRNPDTSLLRGRISGRGRRPSCRSRLSCSIDHRESRLWIEPVLISRATRGRIMETECWISPGFGCPCSAGWPKQFSDKRVGGVTGYSCFLGDRSRVMIGGWVAPVKDRVCTKIPGVESGGQFGLLGERGENRETAEERAALGETVIHEIVAGIAPAIPLVAVGAA